MSKNKKPRKIKTINTRVPACLIKSADESVIEINHKATKKKLIGSFGRAEFLERLSLKAPELVREMIGSHRKRKPKAAPVIEAQTGETNGN